MEEKASMDADIRRAARKQLFSVFEGGLALNVLSATARLGIADHLAERPHNEVELSDALGAADPEIVVRFLRVAESIGLVRRIPGSGRFEETPMLTLLRREDGSCRNTVLAFTAPSYSRPAEMAHLAVLSGRATTEQALGKDLWEHYADNLEEATWFAGAMRELTNTVADCVLAGYSFAGRDTVVDVGGSHGVFLSRILLSYPEVKGILFDRPEVVEQARRPLDDLGLTSRVRFIGGSFLREVPDGGGLYMLKSVLCDWDDENCTRILSCCRNAMGTDTPLVIVDWLRPDQSDVTLDSIDLLQAILVNGRVRTLSQYETLLHAADLRLNRVLRTATGSEMPATVMEVFRR
ncbi:methyltransferase [Streptomyces altiplanensis]